MTVYFETPGDYSEQVFELVNQKLKESSIDTVIVATTRGQTALYAAENVKNARIIAVTHQAGFRNPGEMEISKEVIESLKEKGVEVLTATHALAGVDRAIRKKHGTWQISELIAETLRIFGQGTKVVAEIVLMAADAGLIKMEDVISVGGTGSGADTAWVVKPAHTNTFFELQMRELLCKPRDF
ncbi:MAG: hypothetical protein K9W46_11875 [Candidatus Heimdallarchaeum endolithica]|uniref:Pyruvate kinase C-terminal domain-containing protein n=1 Tax=Candidatus Heimdallarchaeum endolithica TaxID=2876572 RepID=A0A9Y1BPZ5_9ARCH|nr:MAG: hypothetical protein K9W46_11875 [Candidatus Heimdallarchaeum endolithica]